MALSACVVAPISRHESMRTVFKVDQSGAPTQGILSPRRGADVPFERVDRPNVPRIA